MSYFDFTSYGAETFVKVVRPVDWKVRAYKAETGKTDRFIYTQSLDDVYPYTPVGGGGFNKEIRVWIQRNLINLNKVEWSDQERYEMTVKTNNVKIEKSKTGKSWVVRPGNEKLWIVFVHCGFRGSANIDSISGGEAVVENGYYHSERGSLGVSWVALIRQTADPMVVECSRSGRTYGSPKKLVVTVKGGKVEFLPPDVPQL